MGLYEEAIRRNPDLADAPDMNLGMALLKLGELPRGFREFEWRWQTRQFTPFMPPHPRWDGSPLPDKTLLVHTEQGAGDAIQFIRFFKYARQRVGHLLLIAPDPLQALFVTAEGRDQIRGAGSVAEQAFDVHIALVSLPTVLGTTLGSIPTDVPYVQVPDGRTQDALETIFEQPGKREKREGQPPVSAPMPSSAKPLRVGFAWAGSSSQGNDRLVRLTG